MNDLRPKNTIRPRRPGFAAPAARPLAATLPAVLAAALALAALPALAAEENMVDGVLHVQNGAQPEKGNVVVRLEEVWRHGGEDDTDFFGMISQCRVGDDGTIYLLDTRMAEVPVYSPDGERLNTLSREGDGPGETRMPTNLLFMPDGTLGLVQLFPGKVTKISTDGSPMGVMELGDPTAGGLMVVFDCTAGPTSVIVTAESIKPENGGTAQTRTNFVAGYDAEGKETVRYFENPFFWDFTNFTLNEEAMNRVDFRKVAAGEDGRVYIVPERNAYKINVYLPDGTLDRVITREYEHRMRTDEEFALSEVAANQLRQIPNAKVEMSKSQPDIGSLEIGRDGNLWVTSSRSGFEQPEGILTTWDVFTPDGQFLKTVSAQCAGDGENDILIWTPDGNAVMVTGFVEAARALQSGGAGAESEDDGEAAPMEVIYMKTVS